MRSVFLISAVAAATLLCSPPGPAQDLTPPQASPPPQDMANAPEAPAASSLTRADVEAWLDGFMGYGLPRGDVAGAIVVIVKDGETLLQKGYGYADVTARKPVDPETTLFRPGSVSKLFTWTAVMQLVEQGKLDLDADVNGYLDFEIPARDGKPVTLRNILTHTPGFEEQVKGIMSLEEDGVPALDEHLKRAVPQRIFAPGSTPAYSNYATALAGYIVARASGMPFDDYLDAHLFAPLEMRNSTFRQPLPERLKPLMSKGYAQASLPEKPYEIVGPAPAGSLAAPGADMANFMIAHLQGGRFRGAQILKPETARQMHDTALTVLPRVNRMVLGFYETNYNGHRVIAHGGDTQWFHSYLHLFLDDGIGLYMSFNSTGREGAVGGLRSALFEQFADRYLPGDALDGEVPEDTAREHARLIAGSYDNSRRSESSFISLLNLASPAKVGVNEDGTISVSMFTDLAGNPIKWREVEPFVWRQVDGKQLLSAEVKDGRVARFSVDDVSPFMMFEPAPASVSSTWLLPALLASLAVFLLSSLAWPVSALTRRHYRVPYGLVGEDAKAHRRVRIAALAALGLFVAWGLLIVTILSSLSMATPSIDWLVWLLQLVSLVVFFAAAVIGLWNARVVLRSARRWYAKLWAVLLALGFLVALWVALAFRLIAFDANF
jgi:CubicO group peptidase (beta-lactamase class C family)